MALYSLFSHSSAPTLDSSNAGVDVNQNLGTIFQASAVGTVTSAWVYVGNLSMGGGTSRVSLFPYVAVGGAVPAALGSQDFTFQATVGWQQVTFSTPIAISAGTNYIIAYRTPAGHYSYKIQQFSSALVVGPLTAPAGGGNDNGRFRNDAVSYYPTGGSGNNAWYGLDVEVSITPNDVPVAHAGSNQTVSPGQVVTLDGSASTDSDGTIAAYAWTQTSGQTVSLSNAAAAEPNFTAPPLSASGDQLIFSLVVTDNNSAVSANTSTVTVTIEPLSHRNIRVGGAWQYVPVVTRVAGKWVPQVTASDATITHGEQLTTDIVGLKGLGKMATDLQSVTPGAHRLSSNASYGLPPWIPNQPYVYNSDTSNRGGIVPSGGLTIDGFFVPAGVWVSQFQNYTGNMIVRGDNGGADPAWPGIVFRGCRYRAAVQGAGFLNDTNSNVPVNGKIWVLFCDMGGPGAQDTDYCEIPLKFANAVSVCYRNYITYATTGIQVNANGSSVLENYIDKITYYYGPNPPPGESTDKHLNGITVNGSQVCMRVERNKIFLPNPDEAGRLVTQTDCISFFQDFGDFPGSGTNDDGTTGYRVLNNYLGGGGYCIYAGRNTGTPATSVQNMVVAGNKIATTWWTYGGAYGALTAEPAWGSYGNLLSGNTWADGPRAGQDISVV